LLSGRERGREGAGGREQERSGCIRANAGVVRYSLLSGRERERERGREPEGGSRRDQGVS